MYPSIVIMNADVDLKSNHFEHAEGIYVSSIFRTIQGEGKWAGYPAVFIRLAGCNFGSKSVACNSCDTSFQLDKSTAYTATDLFKAIEAHRQPNDILVFTGGEPTLQHNLLDLIQIYVSQSHTPPLMQIETNGTQPSFFNKAKERHLVNYIRTCVSPKALIKANKYAKPSPIVLKFTDFLKFVITSDETSAHHTVPDWGLELAAKGMRVYVSPTAVYNKPYAGEVSSIWDSDLVNKDETSKNYAYAAKYALEHNLLLSLQTHLFVGIA